MSSPPAQPDPAPHRGRIGLWGAPASGKTTFLAALHVAVDRGESPWLLYGRDDRSTNFLADNTFQLVREKTFPSATVGLSQNLAWTLRGSREVRERGRFGLSRRRDVVTEIDLELLDAPGGYFSGAAGRPSAPTVVRFDDEDEEQEETEEERLLQHLSSCHGLIYLFDPTRERARKDSYDYFQRTVLQIAQRSARRSKDLYLPQHLAVCITKFDHPHVYEPAVRRGLTDRTLTPEQFPVVPDELAGELFTMLCEADRENSAILLDKGIRRYFHPERTRYFMTSAVGFYLDPAVGRFQHAQPWNVIEETGPDGDVSRILGEVHPINVLEPLAWLAETILLEK